MILHCTLLNMTLWCKFKLHVPSQRWRWPSQNIPLLSVVINMWPWTLKTPYTVVIVITKKGFRNSGKGLKSVFYKHVIYLSHHSVPVWHGTLNLTILAIKLSWPDPCMQTLRNSQNADLFANALQVSHRNPHVPPIARNTWWRHLPEETWF